MRVQKLFDPLVAMKTFKLANPGCTIGDFVRWCSTEDWKEEMVTEGKDKATNEVISDTLACIIYIHSSFAGGVIKIGTFMYGLSKWVVLLHSHFIGMQKTLKRSTKTSHINYSCEIID